MALHLLNVSVDSADPDPEYIPEDLSFNDQESIIEIVVEQLLGFDNAIQEYDDNDTEDKSKNGNVKIDLTVHFTYASCTSQSIFGIKKRSFPDYEAYLTNGFHQLHTPPPKI